jgi:hypothetical protein
MIEDMQGKITLMPHQTGKGAAFLIQLPVNLSTLEQSD